MDFQIVADTREQAPYTFPCAVLRKKLDAGDYSVLGHEHAVAVERKSLGDFARTVIHDQARFEVELEKLSRFKSACIVVEADLDALLRKQHAEEVRGAAPTALLGAALHMALRYHVPVMWCGSRQAACCFTEQYLRMFVRLRAQGLVR